jgi:hypothetical protein
MVAAGAGGLVVLLGIVVYVLGGSSFSSAPAIDTVPAPSATTNASPGIPAATGAAGVTMPSAGSQDTPAAPSSVKWEDGAILWNFYASAEGLSCNRIRNGTGGHIDFSGMAFRGATVTKYKVLETGSLTTVVETRDKVYLVDTPDQGENWTSPILISEGMHLDDAAFSRDDSSNEIVNVSGTATAADLASGISAGDKVQLTMEYPRNGKEWKLIEKRKAS